MTNLRSLPCFTLNFKECYLQMKGQFWLVTGYVGHPQSSYDNTIIHFAGHNEILEITLKNCQSTENLF